ncbi:MAG: hypothetical protein GDA53_10345 [Rhodobacteraceae bacterium]|nr:hypothetical protein [Paracoccaceae bacterium]
MDAEPRNTPLEDGFPEVTLRDGTSLEEMLSELPPERLEKIKEEAERLHQAYKMQKLTERFMDRMKEVENPVKGEEIRSYQKTWKQEVFG